VPLTHIEVRRGSVLRLRIAIADDAIGEAGDELGALLRKLAPSTVTRVVPAAAVTPAPSESIEVVEDFVVGTTHDDNDETYHEGLRQSLSELFSSLCDAGLDDALAIARQERARRAEGGN
jgi:hypothetical protein